MMKPRPAQTEAAAMAISQNTIINMRTGGGKTLIAAIVIDHFLALTTAKKVMFLVPSRALVNQQAVYLRERCSKLRGNVSVVVTELCGQDLEGWNQTLWSGTMDRCHVLVGTSEVFRRALVDRGFIRPSQFSLIVFDECHNAVGNSPMAAILKDSVLRASAEDRPHILGLTASFDSGAISSSKIIKKRQELEALFQANIYSPEESVTEAGLSDEKSMEQVPFAFEDMLPFRPSVLDTVEQVFRDLSRDIFNEKERKKWVEKGFTVFEGIGAEGLRFWLREGVVQQLLAQAEGLEKMQDAACQNRSKRLKANLLPLQSKLANVSFSTTVGLPQYSQQCISLLKLLWNLYKASLAQISEKSGMTGVDVASARMESVTAARSNVFRGIIFVEQVAYTYPVAYIVNSFFSFLLDEDKAKFSGEDLLGIYDDLTDEEVMNFFFFQPRSEPKLGATHAAVDSRWIMALPVSGSSSMEDSTREANLNKFRLGEVPLLVSTNALEEGIDVPDCSLIIRYDAINTTKAHIQGSGRARCRDARVYYFKNDPVLECAKAKTLQDIARNHRLNLTERQLTHELKIMQTTTQLHSTCGVAGVALKCITYPFRAVEFHAQRDAACQSDALSAPGSCSGSGPASASASASASVIASSVHQRNHAVNGVQRSSGEVHLFNCLPIYYEYVQQVTGQIIVPDSLFEILEEEIPLVPSVTKKTVAAVLYPTPEGMQRMDIAQINAIWGDKRVDEVVSPPSRLVGMGTLEIEKRRTVFCVVVYLHELGLLDVSNEPTQKALAVTPGSIPLIPPTDTTQKIRNRYSSASLVKAEHFEVDVNAAPAITTSETRIKFQAAIDTAAITRSASANTTNLPHVI
jgi:ERCC4-related helicase